MPAEPRPNLTRFRVRPFRHANTGRAMWGLQRDRGRDAPAVFFFVARDVAPCLNKIKRIAALESRAKHYNPDR